MLQPLPAETVFEAQRRAKRATVRLFFILIILYILFFNLLLIAFFLGVGFSKPGDIFRIVPNAAYWCTAAAAGLAIVHFLIVRAKPLGSFLAALGTVEADPQDGYHRRFLNLIQEAEAATGIRPIRAVLLPTSACNAFAIQDGKGNCAIGVTEGLLARLDREELTAVVAHEAAHLVQGDSRLVTTACFLFSIFGRINGALGRMMGRSSYRSSRRGGGVAGVVLVLWIVSGLGYLVTRLVSMAIAREREYMADAHGVQMCKDPLALAEALYKISQRYQGNVPGTYTSLFLLSTNRSNLGEKDGFLSEVFSTHPPVMKRLDKLMAWAKTDLGSLQERMELERKEKLAARKTPGKKEKEEYLVQQGGKWVGPHTPQQLLALGLLTPSTWVCKRGGQDVVRAFEAAPLLGLLKSQAGPKGDRTALDCPRCRTSLLKDGYEGLEVDHCAFCGGNLLRAGYLERLVSREERVYSAEEIKKARIWRDAQGGPLGIRDSFPVINCPYCSNRMAKTIHSVVTQVVVDRCTRPSCGAVWCDGGELENIQMLMEQARDTGT